MNLKNSDREFVGVAAFDFSFAQQNHFKKTAVAFKVISQGNADLTARLEASSKDEVGLVVAGFNGFIGKIHSIVSEIKRSNKNLDKTDEELQ